MRIQSKATKQVHLISPKEWDSMGYKKHLYDIIDTSDSPIPSIKIEEIKFEKVADNVTPQTMFEDDSFEEGVEQLCLDNTKAELQRMLDENEIKYKNKNKTQLAEIYLKWTRKNY